MYHQPVYEWLVIVSRRVTGQPVYQVVSMRDHVRNFERLRGIAHWSLLTAWETGTSREPWSNVSIARRLAPMFLNCYDDQNHEILGRSRCSWELWIQQPVVVPQDRPSAVPVVGDIPRRKAALHVFFFVLHFSLLIFLHQKWWYFVLQGIPFLAPQNPQNVSF